MRRVSSSCTDVSAARNSLSKNCSELQHPAETTRISFALPCSDNRPAEPEKPLSKLALGHRWLSLHHTYLSLHRVEQIHSPELNQWTAGPKPPPPSVPARFRALLLPCASPSPFFCSSCPLAWCFPDLIPRGAGGTTFWVEEPVATRKRFCGAVLQAGCCG